MSEMPAFELGFVERGDGEPAHDTGIAFSGEELELELRGPGANRTMPRVVRAVNAHDALVEALKEAELQIQYLHEKFQATGTGEAALTKIRAALAAAQPAGE